MWLCRHNNWAASPNVKTRAVSKTRRVNLMDEDYEAAASSGNGRRIRKPLDRDFVYYSNNGESMGVYSVGAAPKNVVLAHCMRPLVSDLLQLLADCWLTDPDMYSQTHVF